jgi:polyisoprenoid-binding protein YceI
MFHLKSADFFDVEEFPTLHFKSNALRIVSDGEEPTVFTGRGAA